MNDLHKNFEVIPYRRYSDYYIFPLRNTCLEMKFFDDTWFYVAFSLLVLGYTFHSVNIMLICFPLT